MQFRADSLLFLQAMNQNKTITYTPNDNQDTEIQVSLI